MNELIVTVLGGLGLFSGAIVIWLYFRQKMLLHTLSSPSASGYKNKDSSWWYKNKYNPHLPDVAPYGGGRQKRTLEHPALLTDEYPHHQQVHTQHLNDDAFPYVVRSQLLSSTEQALLKALEQTLQRQPYRVFVKVRLADILEVSPDSRDQSVALERLSQKCVDFLICHADTSAIIGAVQLENDQPAFGKRVQQKFIQSALAAADIPLVRVPMRTQYPITALGKVLNHKLNTCIAPETETATIPVPKTTCPKCGAPLKKMQVKSGKHTGKLFWTCTHFPRCKTALPV